MFLLHPHRHRTIKHRSYPLELILQCKAFPSAATRKAKQGAGIAAVKYLVSELLSPLLKSPRRSNPAKFMFYTKYSCA